MSNFWKNRYADQWEASNAKEKQVADLITAYTGREVEFCGFGAGSTKFISGSAKSNGHNKGDADLHVVNSDVFVEVTGSHKPIRLDAPIWIRPDKILHAERMLSSQKIVVVHYVENVFRVISLNKGFIHAFHSGNIRTITPMIRGVQERFAEIIPSSRYVAPMNTFLSKLKDYLAR